MKLPAFFFFLMVPLMARAFPEMIRNGYVNCTACHVSPAGGGVLTPYGRGLSSELLSTWGSEAEAAFLHGALPPEALGEWLQFGGDIRGLQYHYENKQIKEGRWIKMQAMVEAAARFKNWWIDLGIGKFDNDDRWSPAGNRYFLLHQFTDMLSARVGRFLPQFGLNIPEHISPTRAALGFGALDERDAAEIQFADENWTLTGTLSQAPQSHRNADEKAIALRVERVFSDTLKPGLSYWRGEDEQSRRQMVGIHGLFGFTKKFFWLSEWDWQEQASKNSGAVQHAGATSQKWGYEFHKGVIGLVVADAQLAHLEDPATRVLHYGGGLQFFPRPHFEIEGLWTREQAPQLSSTEGDYAWLLLHYYL